jgi:AcrR family transcriptional regulator
MDTLTTKGERTRQRLIDAAIKQFGNVGYRQTSLASVARSVGLTPAAAYPYFATKHDLFLAAGDADAAKLVEGANKAKADAQFPWLALTEHIFAHIEQHPMLWRLINDEPPELARECFQFPSIRAALDELLVDVQAGKAMGVFRADLDTELTALGLETLFFSLVMLRARSGLTTLDRRFQAISVLIINALFTPPDTVTTAL